MKKKQLYWFFQILGWSTVFLVQLFVQVADNQPIHKMLLLGEGLQAGLNILLTHCFREIIIRFKWLNVRMIFLIPMVFVSVFVLSAIASSFLVVFVAVQTTAAFEDLMFSFLAQLLESLFVFALWALAYFVFLYFERYNKSLKYEAAVRETELNNLKSQLNPHFIFNALNSIRALVDEDPKKSKLAITQLSHILRNSLNSDRQKLVSFAEEFRTVQDYLGLESIRYEERLKTHFDIADGSEDFNLPPLMLQTLVENSIKHGIAKYNDGGSVSIKTKVEKRTLVVQIRNTGQLKIETNLKSGFGISNTKKRLSMIYGETAFFKIKNEDENTVLTEITLPK